MVELISGTVLGQLLQKMCASSQRVRMAVAFWGEGAYEVLNLPALPKEIRVVCNLRSGGTNPRTISAIINAGVDVRQMDDLHAKIYLLDEIGVIGSSNVSANGLSMQSDELSRWTELNVQFSPNDEIYGQAEKSFEDVWRRSKPIYDTDLKVAERKWSLRREVSSPPKLSSKIDLLNALSASPDKFTDRRIYLRLDVEEMSEEAVVALQSERTRTSSGNELDCWEDWVDMPDQATIISFLRGSRGGLTFDGFWYSPRVRREKRTVIGSSIQLVDRLDDVQGVQRVGPINKWKVLLEYMSTNLNDHGAVTIEAGAFIRDHLPHE